MSEIEKTVSTKLTEDQIATAANLNIFSEDGKEVRFGDLFETQKTIVIFFSMFVLFQFLTF